MELTLVADFFREFCKAGPCVIFLKAAATAGTLVWRTVGALVSRSPEGHQLIETVANASECAGKTFNDTNGVTSVVTFCVVIAQNGDRDFFNGENNVTNSTTELAGSSIFGSRWSLNVSERAASKSEQ